MPAKGIPMIALPTTKRAAVKNMGLPSIRPSSTKAFKKVWFTFVPSSMVATSDGKAKSIAAPALKKQKLVS